MNKKHLLIIAVLFTLLASIQNGFASTWSVTVSGNTFTITRSGYTGAETVHYRTVDLTAFAGQHYTAKSGSLTFGASESSKTVTVTETAPGATTAYAFQRTAERAYRFEVLDAEGFELAHCDRSREVGVAVSGKPFKQRNTQIIGDWPAEKVSNTHFSKERIVMPMTAYFDQSAPQGYFQQINAELRMSLESMCRELLHCYQHIQIILNDSVHYDTRQKEDDTGECSTSIYTACFSHSERSLNWYYKKYLFPVASLGDNAGSGSDYPWASLDNKVGVLKKQHFKSGSRAADGQLKIPTSTNHIVLRYESSKHLSDFGWVLRNTYVKITAVDATAPSATLASATVNTGTHNRGNVFYISIPFSELVTISGSTKKLSTSWGDATYYSGSGTNVLTFRGTINVNAGTTLAITGFTGTISDLAGNAFSGSLSKTFSGVTSASPDYAITYNLNGGSVSGNPASYTWESGAITLKAPTKTGYTFTGWTGSNGTTPKMSVTIPAHSHGPRTYTANWSANAYSVVFNANGGSGTMSKQSFTYDAAQKLTANAFTRTGYTFGGWTINANGSGTVYTNKQSVSNLTNTKNGTVTLYAKWTAISYTITYDLNGGALPSGKTNPASYTAATTAFTLQNPSKSGATFAGWTGSNGSTPQTSISIPKGSTGNRTYKANWGSGVRDISSATDWNNFCDVIDGGDKQDGVTVNLLADITVTRMATKTFSGTFEGHGYTLTFNYTATADNAAPFAYITGATIRNLHTTGTINTAYKFAAGLVAISNGGTIENCRSSVIINSTAGDGTHGGLVGDSYQGTLTINNCLFDGKMLGTNTYACGGIVGWHKQGTLNISNTLFAPAEMTIQTTGGAIFARNGVSNLTNCYYISDWAAATMQGTNAGSMTKPELVAALNNGDKHWCIHRSSAIPIMVNLVINNASEWNSFASNVSDYNDKYVKLNADISVTTIATSSFTGIFDGNGHTLTFNPTSTGSNIAPFVYLNGGTIMNLTTTGSVSSSGAFSSGLVSHLSGGDNLIEGCTVHVNVSGVGFVAGVVGHANNAQSLTIRNCVCSSNLVSSKSSSGDNYGGGFVGWYNNTGYTLPITITDCLFKGTYSGGGIFHPIGVKKVTEVNIDRSGSARCYYTANPAGNPSSGRIVYAGTKVCELTIGTPGVSITSGNTCTFQGTTYYYGAVTLDYNDTTAIMVAYKANGYNVTGNSFTINTGAAFTSGASTITATPSYTITYDLDGGTLDAPSKQYTNPTVYCPDTATVLRNPNKEGYAFYGWTGSDLSSASRTDAVNVNISAGSTGNRTYSADFRQFTEGPWSYVSTATEVCNTTANPTLSYDGMNLNTIWMNPYPWQDGAGFGLTEWGTSGAGNTKYGLYTIFRTDQFVTSYSRRVLHWNYDIASYANKFHQTVALYVDDDMNTLKALNVDMTADYTDQTGSDKCIGHHTQTTTSSASQPLTGLTHDFEFDNRNGANDETMTKVLLMTQVIANTGSSAVTMHHWGGFKNQDMTWDEYYYKHITFDANGGEGTMAPVTIENSGALPTNAFTYSRKIFDGWTDGEKIYADGATITADALDKGPLALQAIWKDIPMATCVAPEGIDTIVYDGASHILVKTPGSTNDGTMQYALGTRDYYPADNEWGSAFPAATNAGDYAVLFRVLGDANHSDLPGEMVPVRIEKAPSTLTAPTPNTGLAYTGSAQELLETYGTAVGGELQYSIDEGNTWSPTVPTAVNAGDYTVYYRLVGDMNHLDVEGSSFSVSVAKVPLTIKADDKVLNYGDPAYLCNQATYTGFVGGDDPNVLSGPVQFNNEYTTGSNVGTYTNTPYGVTAANYDITFVPGTITVNKAAATLTAPTAISGLIYDGNPQPLVNAGSATGGELQYKINNGAYSTALPEATDPGDYTIWYRVVGDINHMDISEASLSVTIGVPSGSYTIHIHDIFGGEYALCVNQATTIEQVKEMLADRTDYAKNQMTIIFNNKQLEDDKTLGDYNIQVDAQMDLVPHVVESVTANQDPQHPGTYYSTFYDSQYKFALPNDGTEAYVATISGNDMLLTKIAGAGEVIPANTAVILKAVTGSVDLVRSTDVPVSFETVNALLGTDVSMPAPAHCYVLSGHSSDNTVQGVGFYQFSGNLKAHKAYLVLNNPSSAPKRLRFVFNHENTATGIETPSLQGRSGEATKVIENGVLYIIRDGVRYDAQGKVVE